MNEFNFLIINVHSCRNAGDAALLQATIDLIKHNFSVRSVTIVMDDSEVELESCRIVCSLSAWVKPKGKWNIHRLILLVPFTLLPILIYRYWGVRFLLAATPQPLQNLLEAYLQADVVISKPGGFLYSSGHGLAFAIAAYELLLAVLAGKPIYILPQSIGPLKYFWERILIKIIANSARIIMIREPISIEELIKCGVPQSRCKLVPDLAFSFCPNPPTQQAKSWLYNKGVRIDAPLLGVTVINWADQNKKFGQINQINYETSIISSIKWFVEQTGGQVLIFPQVWGPLDSHDDRIIGRRLKERLCDLGDSVIVIEETVTPEILKAAYGIMDIFIATRLHSAIFAWSQAVPVMAISYQHKTLGLAKMLGMEKWVIDIETINPDQLVGKVQELWTERDEVRKHLKHHLPDLIHQAIQIGPLLARDLNEFIKITTFTSRECNQ